LRTIVPNIAKAFDVSGPFILIWGSNRCDLGMKIGGEDKAHEISRTQQWFGKILPDLGDIKIINIFNGFPKSKLRKNKILMGINIKLG